MVSWDEELARREAVAREQVEHLRRQVAELAEQLAVAEQRLSRLAITRETMAEILTEAQEPQASGRPQDPSSNSEASQPHPISAVGTPIGVMRVPQRIAGMDAEQVLPDDYCDLLAVLAEAGHGLRAGQIGTELGVATTDRSKVEALRSKLKRLVARGWLEQQPSGQFSIAQ